MAENSIVYVYMAILAIATFVIALYSVKYLWRTSKINKFKWVLIGVPVIGSVLSLYAFLHPDIINIDTTANKILSTQFAVGPYPELPKMFELKNEGYTAIISLLHPAVVPFEPSLIAKEKENAQEAGLQFINIPFLPWISENRKAVDSLRHLIRTGKEKYYIHCYLGRDRTSAATKIIQQENQTMIDLSLKKKNEEAVKPNFERGAVIALQKDVYLGPEPTKEEYLYIVAAFKQVIFLSDLSKADNKKQLFMENEWLTPYNIPMASYTLSKNLDQQKIKVIAEEVQKLPKPVFIHGYGMTAAQMEQFRTLYQQAIQ